MMDKAYRQVGEVPLANAIRSGQEAMLALRAKAAGVSQTVTDVVPTVPEALAKLGELYRERNKIYKDNYLHFGQVCVGIFPNGIELRTAEDFNRFALFIQALSKFTRYGQAFAQGGHADSCDDTSVYMQMIREYDALLSLRGGDNGKASIG